MGQHSRQRGEGVGKGDKQRPLFGLNGGNRCAGQYPWFAPGLLQRKRSLLGIHLAAIVKMGVGAQRESPLQAIL